MLNFLKKAKKSVKKRPNNRVFSARASPSNLVKIGAKGVFRKFLGSVTKYGYLKIVQRGDPLGREGVESLKGNLRPPPLNPLPSKIYL